MPEVSVLNVLLHGQAIGTLTLLPGERTLFAFNDAYIENLDRPTLSLSFKDQFGGLITEHPPTRTAVPPFFSNLLPEGHLRTYLAKRAGVKEQREFFLLWMLGQDLPGALTIAPTDGQKWPPISALSDSAQKSDEKPVPLRFSLAGVQLKFSAVMGASGGLTIPAKGIGGSWIIKLPSATFAGMPENEFSMMTLARHIGMDIPEVRLVDTGTIKGLPEGLYKEAPALAIKRFDRAEGAAIHMEDFAQVFGMYPDRKYDRASYRNIAQVLWTETGMPGISEFVRRLIFSVLTGNADMHLKNWSLLYPDGRHPVLSPGYDFVSTIAFLDDANLALNLVKTKNMADVSREALTHFAAKARLPEGLVLKTATETVERFIEAWGSEKSHLPLTAAMISTIETHLAKLALVKEMR